MHQIYKYTRVKVVTDILVGITAKLCLNSAEQSHDTGKTVGRSFLIGAKSTDYIVMIFGFHWKIM